MPSRDRKSKHDPMDIVLDEVRELKRKMRNVEMRALTRGLGALDATKHGYLGGGGQHEFIIASGGNTTVSDQTWTKLAISTVDDGGGNNYVNLTNNVFQCPSTTEAGLFIITAHVGFSGDVNGNRRLIQLVHSTDGTIGRQDHHNHTSTAIDLSVSAVAHLTSGQTVEVQAWHNNGTTLTIALKRGAMVRIGNV